MGYKLDPNTVGGQIKNVYVVVDAINEQKPLDAVNAINSYLQSCCIYTTLFLEELINFPNVNLVIVKDNKCVNWNASEIGINRSSPLAFSASDKFADFSKTLTEAEISLIRAAVPEMQYSDFTATKYSMITLKSDSQTVDFGEMSDIKEITRDYYNQCRHEFKGRYMFTVEVTSSKLIDYNYTPLATRDE